MGMEITATDKYVIERQKDVSRLSVMNVTLDDAEMTYTCKASNPGGHVTSTANILLQAPKAPERRRSSLAVTPPQFTETFKDETFLVKKNMTLTAKVTGKPEPEVKWFRDDKPIAPSFKTKMNKSGETVSLQQSSVTTKQSGVYKVVASSKAGTAEHSANIKIVEKLEPEKPKEAEKPKESPKPKDEPKPKEEPKPKDEPKEEPKRKEETPKQDEPMKPAPKEEEPKKKVTIQEPKKEEPEEATEKPIETQSEQEPEAPKAPERRRSSLKV